MNAKTLFAAATLSLLGAASFAGEVTEFAIPASTLTRAEVQATVTPARAANDLVAVGESYGSVQPARATQRPVQIAGASRSEVRAAAERSVADGSYAQAGEAYGTVQPASGSRTRAEVRAEAVAFAHGRAVTATRGL
jgi:hypothetical protein